MILLKSAAKGPVLTFYCRFLVPAILPRIDGIENWLPTSSNYKIKQLQTNLKYIAVHYKNKRKALMYGNIINP